MWLLGTFLVWLDAERSSELVMKGRKTGIWRAILDLAEAANRDLGPHTCAYSEEEIVKALDKKSALKYGVRQTGVESASICLESAVEVYGKRKKFKLNWEQEYGGKGEDN